MSSKPTRMTLQLVCQERRESNPEGSGYSQFCDLYRRWLKKLDLVLRQTHRAGEKTFVDYAGAMAVSTSTQEQQLRRWSERRSN